MTDRYTGVVDSDRSEAGWAMACGPEYDDGPDRSDWDDGPSTTDDTPYLLNALRSSLGWLKDDPDDPRRQQAWGTLAPHYPTWMVRQVMRELGVDEAGRAPA